MDLKLVNNFIYAVSEDGTEVTVAYKANCSNLAGQIAVNRQLDGILTRTGMYRDMVHDGYLYIGIIFHNTISEDELVTALSVPKPFPEEELLATLPVVSPCNA